MQRLVRDDGGSGSSRASARATPPSAKMSSTGGRVVVPQRPSSIGCLASPRGGGVRVLVTGGAGFIGSHLVDALVGRGDDVRVLDDLSTGLAANVPAEAEMLVGSITDERLVRRAVADIEIVFHQAALGSVQRSVNDPLASHAANVTGTLLLLRAAAESEVGRLVFASSSSVYGGTGVLPTPESTVPVPRSPYAVSKLASEHYCRVFTELDELETVSLRYFNVYGPRQRADSRVCRGHPALCERVAGGARPDDLR